MKATLRRTIITASAVGVFVLAGIFSTVSAGAEEGAAKGVSAKKAESEKTHGTPNWSVPVKAAEVKNPFSDNSKATKAGKATFDQICFACHGSQGKGDGMAAVTLKPKPADFTSEVVQGQTDGALYWKMTNGRGPMASYEGLLKDKQRWQLVNYIRVLGKAANAKADKQVAKK